MYNLTSCKSTDRYVSDILLAVYHIVVYHNAYSVEYCVDLLEPVIYLISFNMYRESMSLLDVVDIRQILQVMLSLLSFIYLLVIL